MDILLDTNILIYLSKGEEKYIQFIETLKEKKLAISIFTYMELLVGNKNNEDFLSLSKSLKSFNIIDFNKDIANIAINYLQIREKESLRDPKFINILIPSTAILYSLPLMTNNPKNFSFFRNLNLIIL